MDSQVETMVEDDKQVDFEFVGVKEELNDFASFGLSLGDELVLDTEAQQQFPPEHHDEIDNFLQEQQQLSAEDYDCEINNFLQNNLEFPTEDDDEIKNFSFLDSHSAQNEFTNNDKEWFGLLMELNLPVPVEEADNNTSSEAQPSLSYEELQSTPAFVFPPDNPPLEEEEDDKQSVKRNADSFLALKPVAKRFKTLLSPRSPKSTTKESSSKPINLDKLKFTVKFYSLYCLWV